MENKKIDIVLATGNAHKLFEIQEIAKDSCVNFSKVEGDFDPDENGETFEENAYIKAFEAAKMMNKIALADDTGLCVEALNGAPGLFSARYADTQQGKITKLLSELADVPASKRSAYFICSMALVKPDGEILHKTEGRINGFITQKDAGKNGFGYDPIFYVPELDCTMAEMTEGQKNSLSHRANALNPMLEWIETNLK